MPPLGAVGEPQLSMLLASALMFLGVIAQFIQKMAELEDAGQGMTPWAYLRAHPYRAASMVMASEILLFVWQAMGELSVVSSILTGYACQSAAETLRARANSRINQGTQ
jgi:hypothetical protein